MTDTNNEATIPNENQTSATEQTTSENQESETQMTSAENASEQTSEITEESGEGEPEKEEFTPQVVALAAQYIPQNNILLIDLGSVEFPQPKVTPTPAIPRAPKARSTRKRTQVPARASESEETSATSASIVPPPSNGKPSKLAGQKVRIHAPEPGLVVRTDQTLMLKMNKDGSANILQTENWGYPPMSMTPESLGLKSKSTANFLSFQEPVQGFRFAYMVNYETKDVVRVVRKGKFRASDVRPFMEKGYSEFLYSSHASKFFRLPTGEIVQCKRQVDLDPETTVTEAKKQTKQGNQASVAAITGTLTGIMT